MYKAVLKIKSFGFEQLSVLLSKGLLFLYIFYKNWFSQVYDSRGIGTILVILATVLLLPHMFFTRYLNLGEIPPMLKTYFGFGVYIFAAGMLTAVQTGSFFSSFLIYVVNTAFCFDCFYIYKLSGKLDWIGKAMLGSAIVCVIQVLAAGVKVGGRITMSERNNSNSLGTVLVMGIFFLLCNHKRMERHFFLNICLLSLLAYTVVLSGSRKSFLCSIVFILLWLILYCKKTFSRKLPTRKIASFFVLGIGILIALQYITSTFLDSTMFWRLSNLVEEQGDTSRSELYKEALRVWGEYPVFGVGFDQFVFHNPYKAYSHSSYAELLACTGIIGFSIFMIPLLKTTYRAGIRLIREKCHENYEHDVFLLMLLIIELLLGAGQIWFYDFLHMVILFYVSEEQTAFIRNGKTFATADRFMSTGVNSHQ